MGMEKAGKILALSLLAVIMISFVSNFVLAETVAEAWGKNLAQGISSFLETIKINPKTSSIVLLGILLWIIIYSIIVKIFNYKGKWGSISGALVSLIIVVLSFLYLPENLVETIVLQYGAMGATILTIIPFIILLYFSISVSRNLFTARVIWIFYIMYYLVIFLYKMGTLEAGSAWYEYLPYLGAMIAGIIIFFALPTIRSLIFQGELSTLKEKAIRDVNFRKLGRKIEREETKARTNIEE